MTAHPLALVAPVAVVLALLAALPACSPPPAQEASDAAAPADPAQGLAIATATARAADNVPLGSVPGTITLPPEARVAVTAPFPGAAVRVFVIEGQAVQRGDALALVRSAEPVQIRGDLARAKSAAALADARAARLGQLAEEGIIAAARADEARAARDQARASVTELSRMAALGGIAADGSMTLRAPISGRVAHVGVETGGGVDAMTAPFVIEAGDAYQIALQLPERLARSVRPGMAVEIALAAANGAAVPVGGKIIAVAPSIDPVTRSVMARARIGAAPGLVAGRNVSVIIRGTAPGIAVPEAAVTRIGEADHVFVQKGKTWAKRAVAVITRSGGEAFIASGLAPGEVVAASSIAELKAMSAE